MIFRRKGLSMEMNTLDFIGLPALAYLGGGLLYGIYEIRYVNMDAFWALCGVVIVWMLLRSTSYVTLEINLSPGVEKALTMMTLLLALSISLFYVIAGPSYFMLDKFDRYIVADRYVFLRTGFWSSNILLCVLLIEAQGRLRRMKGALLLIALSITLIEGSRELLLISGLHIILYFWKFRDTLLVPRGLLGLTVLFAGLFFVAVIFKPLFYIIFLGGDFGGGWLHYSELVNWYRWLYLANTQSIDHAAVQRFDLQYLLDALVMPLSRVPSSSAVWFREVLEQGDGSGRNYGYSGVLWLSLYVTGPYMMVPWALAALGFFLLSRARSVVWLLLMFSICLLSFRLFRSEWVLVVKTLLWVYFYPSVIVYTLARLSIFSALFQRPFTGSARQRRV